MLKIIHVPNNALVTPVKSIPKIDGQIIQLVTDMKKTLVAQIDPQGVGLAAPQVGVNLALFIIRPSPKAKTEVFINPRIVEVFDVIGHSSKLSQKSLVNSNQKPSTTDKTGGHAHKLKTSNKPVKLEGCLSIPRIWGPVKRADKVVLEYQDVTGPVKKRWFTGFKAVIIQHEMDHLQGILFTQRAMEQNRQLYEEVEGELKKVEF